MKQYLYIAASTIKEINTNSITLDPNQGSLFRICSLQFRVQLFKTIAFSERDVVQKTFDISVKVHSKLLISESKFSDPRKFTLRYHQFEITEIEM